MISDLELVEACAQTYVTPPTMPIPMTGVDCRVSHASDGGAIVAFRGSETAEDWVRDFLAWPVDDRAHPQLGLCHAGFLDAALSVVAAVRDVTKGLPWYVTGHSLGGAIAQGVGALLICARVPPEAVVTFGAPRFGMEKFANVLQSVPVRLYRRGNDVVPTVPWDVPPLLCFLDAHAPLIVIGQAQRNPFACHAIQGYVDDVRAFLKSAAA
jgi:hypothetical protein